MRFVQQIRDFFAPRPHGGDSQPKPTGAEASEGPMHHVNQYWQQLDDADIHQGVHRLFVGGMWEEIGTLQFQFLCQQGLRPEHALLDVGCGSLRGGIHFVPYLNTGNYYGLDINASLIEAGKRELAAIDALSKEPHLLVDDQFRFSRFGAQVDYALAISVFSHLYANHILRCLVEMKKVLKADGVFYATFFVAPHPLHIDDIHHEPGGIVSHFDQDPFHYALSEIQAMAASVGFTAEHVRTWQHPRNQQMIAFRHHSESPTTTA